MMSQTKVVSIIIISMVSMVMLPQAQAALPTLQTVVPPLVLNTTPAQGEEYALDEPIIIEFDQPMNQASVEKAFAIEPGATADGSFTWLDDQTVSFALTNGFQRGQRYRVRLVETAESADGTPLNRPLVFDFNAAGFLEVTNTQPAHRDIEILPDTIVTIAFNRPVVALSAIGESVRTEILTFDPPVEGVGEWLNTSIYQFTPSNEGFAPATDYTARIVAGLSDVFELAALADDWEWQFTTITPAAIGSIPADNDIYLSPSPVISLTFNQPMNRDQVEANILLTQVDTDETVALNNFEWADEGLALPISEYDEYGNYNYLYDPGAGPETIGVETVSFTPATLLDWDTDYQLTLPSGTAGFIDGTTTANDYQATFTTINIPEVVNTVPDNDDEFVSSYDIYRTEVTFNAPMDPTSLIPGESLTIEYSAFNNPSQLITPTTVFTTWYSNDTVVNLRFPAQLNTAYTLTIGADVTNRYGEPLGEPYVLRWKTLNAAPAVRFLSPRIATYNGYEPSRLYLTVRNLSEAMFQLYQVPQDEFIGLTSGDDWSEYEPSPTNLVRQWSMPTEPQAHMNYVYELPLTDDETPLEPGIYFLTGNPAEDGIYPEAEGVLFDDSEARVMVVVSKYNVTLKQSRRTALAWVTDLQSGQPIADLPIDFAIKSWDTPFRTVGNSTTQADGVALLEAELFSSDNWHEGTYYAFVGDTPADFAVNLSSWNDGIRIWNYNGVQTEYGFDPFNGYIYTDRNIFRPGQTINFKGVIRANDDAFYNIPPTGGEVKVKINGPQGQNIYTKMLPLNSWGSFSDTLTLNDITPLGGYSIEATYEDTRYLNNPLYLYYNFDVAAYRKPDFMVTVKTDEPEYAPDESIAVTASAEYFAGGGLAEAEVRWTVLADDYSFVYDGPGTYSFIDVADPYKIAYSDFGFGKEIASGTGVTDNQRNFTVEIPADITGKRNSQQFTIEVAVTGLNNQEIANQTRVVVHKGDFYAGVRSGSYLYNAGDPAEAEVIVVDWQGDPVANQTVELIFTEQVWYSVQRQDPEQARTGNPDDSFYWDNLMESKAIYSETVTTNRRGQATASFIPPRGGSYKIYVRAIDSQARQLFASTYMWVSSGAYVNWGQGDDNRMQLVADKNDYQVGDTAKILVPHPYSETVQALITLERGHVYSHTVVTLENNNDQIEIPITEALAPNMYVSAVVMQGAGEQSEAALIKSSQRRLPSFRLGFVHLPIEVAQKKLNISLIPDQDTYQPGDTATFDIEVTNWQGDPVEAELSLALVDKAVLTLAPERVGELFDKFWRERGLGVDTSSGLTLAIDRVNQVIDAKKGGGGGPGPPGIDTVREKFADVPLWVPDFKTDDDGKGSVEVVLPDNLTSWVLIAKGLTGDDSRIGEAQTEIVTNRPLIVRPVAPRFFVVDDTAQIGMIIQNNSSDEIEVLPYFEADGLSVEPVDEINLLTLSPNKEVKVAYNVVALPIDPTHMLNIATSDDEILAPNTVAGQGIITLTMAATADDLTDGVSFTLPVYNFSAPETVATVGVLSEDSARTEGIALPARYDSTQGNLTVNIDPTLAASMLDGLKYLQHYPHSSSEMTISRLLPNLLTYQAYTKLGLDSPTRDSLIMAGIKRLEYLQNIDGGWGWWEDAPSNLFLSTYAMLALIEAEEAGFEIDGNVKHYGLKYLAESLSAPKDVVEPWQGNQQAFILYVLAKAGEGDISRAMTLFEIRQQLDIFGRAYLAMAIALDDPTASQINTLMTDITSEAIVSATGAHWEESQVDFYAMNTDTRSTAIIIAALSRLQPDNPLLPQAVRWLMSVRENGGSWETTQETAWALIGLTDWLVASGELTADYDWRISLNGAELGTGEVREENLTEQTKLLADINSLQADEINRLTVQRTEGTVDSGAGNLYYGAYLTYFKPVDDLNALDRGVLISRQYRNQADEGDTIVSTATVGDVIEVKLTIVAPNDLHYVRVEDPFPAGMEAIDSSLATTSVTNQLDEFSRIDDTAPTGSRHWVSHTELWDERAVLFAEFLPKGTYEYTYLLRAAIPGEYSIMPTHAEQTYFPEVFGRGDGGQFVVQ